MGLYGPTCLLPAKLLFWKYLGRTCISREQQKCQIKKITRLVMWFFYEVDKKILGKKKKQEKQRCKKQREEDCEHGDAITSKHWWLTAIQDLFMAGLTVEEPTPLQEQAHIWVLSYAFYGSYVSLQTIMQLSGVQFCTVGREYAAMKSTFIFNCKTRTDSKAILHRRNGFMEFFFKYARFSYALSTYG